MGVLKKMKKACAKPIKTLENKVIPIINSANTYLDSWVIFILFYFILLFTKFLNIIL